MDRWRPKHVELTYVMNKAQSLENFVYLVGLHIYYKMIHGPYRLKYHCFLTVLKCQCSFWSPKMINVDFEVAVFSAVNKALPHSVITGCNFLLIGAYGDGYRVFVVTEEYRDNEQVRLACRMCADLAHLLINKIEEIILTPVPCISIVFNSNSDWTILILLLYMITYVLLLHVSTLIRHLNGTFCAWLNLPRLLILIKCNC